MKVIVMMFLGLFITLGLITSVSSLEGDPWTVPDKYKKMENPVKADKESLSIGKSLYSKHCKSCHGKEGLGDGSKAAQLDTPSGDFTDKKFTLQSDGSIFYKTLEGRDDMPGFKKKMPDKDDIWSVINYIRTFE